MPILNNTHRWLRPNPYMKACINDFSTHQYCRQLNLNIGPNYFLVEPNYSDDHNTSDVDLFSYIDTYCIELLQKSQAKFIFDSSSEGSYGLEPNYIQLLERSAAKHNIPHKNIFYLTIDTVEANTPTTINVFYFNFMIPAVLSKTNFADISNKPVTHLFSCLNRKPRYWRSKLLYELLQHDLGDKIIYSHPKVSSINDFISRPYNKNEVADNANMVAYYNTLEENFHEDINNPCALLDNIFSKVAFDVAMATIQIGSEEIIDEKIFKPMLLKKPVIIWGIPGINKQGLTALGFKTYEDWFDLSFDDEPDTDKRLHLIKEEIFKVCNHLLTSGRLSQWVCKNQAVLDHNYNLVRNFTANEQSIKRFMKTINAI